MLHATTHLNKIFEDVLFRNLTKFNVNSSNSNKEIPETERYTIKKMIAYINKTVLNIFQQIVLSVFILSFVFSSIFFKSFKYHFSTLFHIFSYLLAEDGQSYPKTLIIGP